ncbi:hypothetical protein [Leclercia sp.]|uniref:DUF7940 domain-containing protein n=1 Tax=Leclercia sp. TaxID=1898428 RepID=UPI0028B0EB0B|nr:hypothetical protein [Leclercia sp.]
MKRINTWLISTWAAIIGYFQFFPQDLNNLWQAMPDDIKASLPPYVAKGVAFALFCAMLIGRSVNTHKEKKVLEQKVEDTKDDAAA